jgi:hypothetical protein
VRAGLRPASDRSLKLMTPSKDKAGIEACDIARSPASFLIFHEAGMPSCCCSARQSGLQVASLFIFMFVQNIGAIGYRSYLDCHKMMLQTIMKRLGSV